MGTKVPAEWKAALYVFQGISINSYYLEMEVIGTHRALRRLWIAEGKRRNFELVDAR